jgi:hypothetical protein
VDVRAADADAADADKDLAFSGDGLGGVFEDDDPGPGHDGLSHTLPPWPRKIPFAARNGQRRIYSSIIYIFIIS